MTTLQFSSQIFVLFFTLFAMMVGMIFTLIPPLPGTVIIWAAAIMYGLVLGWENLGWLTFGLLTFLMIVGVVADVLAGQFGAKIGGASCLAIVIGTVCGLALGIVASFFGTPIAGCLAGVVGTLGGIILVEALLRAMWPVSPPVQWPR
jgi:uncharacterized protein YqgC (DUF456 family)